MQLYYALLCTEGLPSIYGLTLIKPQSIGLNRWDLYWLNTLGTKIYCCSIDLLAMKISSHQHALTKITKPFFSEQHWPNQVDKPGCSLMIVNLLSSKKLRWSLWVMYVDHYIFCRLDFHQENFAMIKSVGKIDLDPDVENIILHSRTWTFNLFAQLSSRPKVRIMYNWDRIWMQDLPKIILVSLKAHVPPLWTTFLFVFLSMVRHLNATGRDRGVMDEIIDRRGIKL